MEDSLKKVGNAGTTGFFVEAVVINIPLFASSKLRVPVQMMDRTVRMSQLWGECRYCPKLPEKNVQNSKKKYKNKKKMCKNKKNVQYSDDPGITSGHMLEVLA